MLIRWVRVDTLLDWIKTHGVVTRQDRAWEMVHHSTKGPSDYVLLPTPMPQYLYRGYALKNVPATEPPNVWRSLSLSLQDSFETCTDRTSNKMG